LELVVVSPRLGCFLVEDAVRFLWVALRVPPTTFFWSTVPEDGFMDCDRCWFFVFKVDVRVVVLERPPDFPCGWVEIFE
jgi:hypothetical protein